jgi:hypothetical protein
VKFQQDRRLCLVHFAPRDLTEARVSSSQQDGILVQMIHQSGELDDAVVVARCMCRSVYDLVRIRDRGDQRGVFFRDTLFGLEAGRVAVRHGLLVWLVSCEGVTRFNFFTRKKGCPSFLFLFLSYFLLFLLPILGANPLHLVKELDDEASEVPERTGLPNFGRKSL